MGGLLGQRPLLGEYFWELGSITTPCYRYFLTVQGCDELIFVSRQRKGTTIGKRNCCCCRRPRWWRLCCASLTPGAVAKNCQEEPCFPHCFHVFLFFSEPKKTLKNPATLTFLAGPAHCSSSFKSSAMKPLLILIHSTDINSRPFRIVIVYCKTEKCQVCIITIRISLKEVELMLLRSLSPPHWSQGGSSCCCSRWSCRGSSLPAASPGTSLALSGERGQRRKACLVE